MPKRWIGGALALLALSPASAGASASAGLYARVLHAYQTTGSVSACRFSSQQLSSVLGSVDTYGQQYYADFIATIQTALAARAAGQCSKTHRAAIPASAARGPTGPQLPPSVTSPTSSGVPAPLVALGILAAALALAALLAVLARRGTGSSEWSHGWAEAR